ncbi:EAL domain-containing protein [Bacillus sp. BRMEA1]|uniref:EAL domain-containing protein n=1 Tax=Neobacillus endophyticus TaxID=2738405 RepID=UPI0015659188|nr:EAL domain-containing protein [Neobacillus endophyticus]NRD77037.1 EAL domain-containing protein [Neobacillus endophyticus]
MKINQKILIFMSILTVLSAAAFYIIVKFVILNTFNNVEKEAMNKQLNTVVFNLNNTKNELADDLANYAPWDDTYSFVQKQTLEHIEDDPYIQSSYVDSTYTSNHFNLIAIINKKGQVMYGRSFDLNKNKQVPIYQDFLPHISSENSWLLQHSNPTSVKTGIISLHEGPMLVVSEPIVTSNYQGPIRGTMIAGRLLSKSEIALLSRKTQSFLEIDHYKKDLIPLDVGKKDGSSKWVHIDNNNKISGYVLLPDIYGNPAFVLHVTSERTIYHSGETSIIYFYLYVSALFLLMVIFIVTFLNKSVISRISFLMQNIKEIIDNKDFSKRVAWKGKDELDDLIHEFNLMMSSMENYEDVIKQQAYFDPLTHLANRNLFYEKLERKIKRSKQNKMKFYVLFIDLDCFKYVNDTYGHDYGDLLLQHVANQLNESVPMGTLVSRLGGDEYTILLECEKAEIEAIISNILENLSKPFTINKDSLHVTASIGMSVYPDHGEEPGLLIKHADIAMYSVKNNGKNNFNIFSNRLENRILENDLHQALVNNEFTLVYQPQINVKTGKILGAEALIRWNHPTLGMVSPNEFIPIAESNGFINEIGEWVLRTACEQNMKWQSSGYSPITMSVNVSRRQLQQKSFIDMVKTILNGTGLSPQYLVLEVTESVPLENFDDTIITLTQLKELGVKIAIDDFGKGYTSLHYIEKFPLDFVKLDKSLIDNLKTGIESVTVKTIIDLCKSLNIATIAEGVETKEQLNTLSKYKCDKTQGYYVSKPLNKDHLEKHLISSEHGVLPFVKSK